MLSRQPQSLSAAHPVYNAPARPVALCGNWLPQRHQISVAPSRSVSSCPHAAPVRALAASPPVQTERQAQLIGPAVSVSGAATSTDDHSPAPLSLLRPGAKSDVPDADSEVTLDQDENPPETGFLHEDALRKLDEYRRVEAHSGSASSSLAGPNANGFAYPPAQRNQIRESWDALMRWSKVFRTRQIDSKLLESTQKVVVFGGGSFGTAMACSLARERPNVEVVLLVRDPYLCRDINTLHENTRYLQVRAYLQWVGWVGEAQRAAVHVLPAAAEGTLSVRLA